MLIVSCKQKNQNAVNLLIDKKGIDFNYQNKKGAQNF